MGREGAPNDKVYKVRSCGLARSFYKLKALYLQQSGDLLRETPTLKVTRNFDQLTNVRSRENLKIYISNFIILMVPELSMLLTSGRALARKRLSRDQLLFFFECTFKTLSANLHGPVLKLTLKKSRRILTFISLFTNISTRKTFLHFQSGL